MCFLEGNGELGALREAQGNAATEACSVRWLRPTDGRPFHQQLLVRGELDAVSVAFFPLYDFTFITHNMKL